MSESETITHQRPGDRHEWDTPPWPLTEELAGTLPEGSWTLVGGLMVRMRALLHDVPPNRATTDVDAAVSLSRKSGVTYSQLAMALQQIGFAASNTGKFSYRFVRKREHSTDTLDLMFPDGVPATLIPRFNGLPVLSIPGGRRAQSQRERVEWQTPDARRLALYIASLRDSLAIKGAAYIVDSRDRNRHLSDAITLLACVETPHEIRAGLSRRSRKRVRSLLRGLEQREPWLEADPVTANLAQLNLVAMRDLFDVTGTMTPEKALKIHPEE